MIDVQEFWKLITDKLQSWLETGVSHLPNLVVALFIISIFVFLSRVMGRLCRRGLGNALKSQQIADLLTSIAKVIIVLAGFFIAMDFVGLSRTVTSLLAGAGIAGLAISLAFQDMTENFIAGVAMGFRKPFQIEHVVKTGDVFGTVRAINLRNTIIETFFGQLEIVPNKLVFRNVLTNYSELGRRRIEIPVGISYADSITEAKKVIVEAVNNCDFVIEKEETDVYAEGFGDSSVNLLVWFWIDYPGEVGFMEARHDAIVAVKQALEDVDILIPFPIRTLDFATKGGTPLKQALEGNSD